ncbi:hypothetical protein QBC46DRAFT_275325 [Diplogelasinospora grovesii]|uniref:Uncharacterized protein n=1 Tax=Diplogelasinospora grovesii TaxID=303347 RepID=A0AAN6MVL8_9PEZI|nr:hypothetical protein QBC46DRAFT_275325 [Diplogelasinospora grovesii]
MAYKLTKKEEEIAYSAYEWASASLQDKARLLRDNKKSHSLYVFLEKLCSAPTHQELIQLAEVNWSLASIALELIGDGILQYWFQSIRVDHCLKILELMDSTRLDTILHRVEVARLTQILEPLRGKGNLLEKITQIQRKRLSREGEPKQKYEQGGGRKVYIATKLLMLTLPQSIRKCNYCLGDYKDGQAFCFQCPQHTIHTGIQCFSRSDGSGFCQVCWPGRTG